MKTSFITRNDENGYPLPDGEWRQVELHETELIDQIKTSLQASNPLAYEDLERAAREDVGDLNINDREIIVIKHPAIQ